MDAEINRLERDLRAFIATVLSRQYRQRWWRSRVPSDIKEKVEIRINHELQRAPYRDVEAYRDGEVRLQYCDVMDYQKIICAKNNWEFFAPYIEAKSYFQIYLEFFSQFRNQVKHNRDGDRLTRKQGEISTEWLSELLKSAHARLDMEPSVAESPSENKPGLSQSREATVGSKDDVSDGSGISAPAEADSAKSVSPLADPGVGTLDTTECAATPLPDDLAPSDLKVIKRIRNSTRSEVNSVEDLLSIDVGAFARLPGNGRLYVERLRDLKRRLGGSNENSNIRTAAATDVADDRADDWPVDSLMLSAAEEKLLKRVRNSGFSALRTVREALEVRPEELADVQGVGETYVRRLIEFQARLRDDLEVSDESEISLGNAEKRLLRKILADEFTLNRGFLSESEQKALSKVTRCETGEKRALPSANRVLEIGEDATGKPKGIGTQTIRVLRELAPRIRAGLLEQAREDRGDIPPPRLIVCNKSRILTIEDVEEIVGEDLDTALEAASPTIRDVVKDVWGYERKKKTLEEAGEELDVTRERTRQYKEGFVRQLPDYLRVHPSVLWANLKPHLEADLALLMPNLRAKFSRDREFIELLEYCSGVESGTITTLQLRSSPDVSVLDDLFCSEPSPYSFETICSALMKKGYRPLQVKHYVTDMIQLKRMRQNGALFSPALLSKESAFAHALLDEPDGLHWKELAEKVNKRFLSRVELSYERLDAALNTADNIFLCGRGTYRHTKFLALSEKDGLMLVRAAKQELERTGKRSESLQAVHQAVAPAIDYFEMRHYLRDYGEDQGLNFDGRSTADTVSLDEDFGQVSTDEYVLGILRDQAEVHGFTAYEVAAKLRSRSVSMARLVLSRLVQSGQVLSKTHGSYVARERCLEGLDPDAIVSEIVELLEADDGNTTLEDLCLDVNSEFGVRYTEDFYEVLIESAHSQMRIVDKDGACKEVRLIPGA